MSTSRLRSTCLAVAGAVCLSLCAGTSTADFNPKGRTRRHKPTPAKKSPSKAAAPKATTPTAAAPTQRSAEALIARYTGIALKQPGATFPLERLSDLYRERDGNTDALVKDFEARLALSPESEGLLLALGWLHGQREQRDKALALLKRAAAGHPNSPAPALALADLNSASGNSAQAYEWLEHALPLQRTAAEREQTLRRLRTLALDRKDLEAARAHNKQLVSSAQGSFFVRSELGRELLERGFNVQAEEEFQNVVAAARGDNRALAPALRDLGKAQAAQEKTEEALKTLQRALRLTSAQSGLRREVLDIVVTVYRRAGRLSDLITLLEREAGGDFARLQLLGNLYEEAGRLRDAQATFKQALRVNPRDIDSQLKVIRLLELQGELDAAIVEYRRLIRTDPRTPDYVFQLAELLMQRGERTAALREVSKLSSRADSDTQTLAAVVDFYERIGEPEKSVALLERIAGISSTDPQHLIELGGRYFSQGNEKRAVQTWKKLLTVVPNRARGLQLLGEVYLEHDMAEEALEALGSAVKLEPNNSRLSKTFALALERTGAASGRAVRMQRYSEAQSIWETLLAQASGTNIQREARQHIVTLWSLQGSLKDRIAPLERTFNSKPPHLPSGRMLAEVYLRLNQYSTAESTLRRVVEEAPGDTAAWTSLERVLVKQRKIAEAIPIAERLVKLEPKRAREHYQRLSKYATDLYRDDQAVEYAAKAVALSPDDASGHQRLADMYRRRQQLDKAVVEYRKALNKNERLFPAYFDLAELLLLEQKPSEADQLLRKVMRSAIDDELIARAARSSMQLHVASDTLDELERELLPLTLSHPNKPIYRRLLVELYGAWAFPLIARLDNPDPNLRTIAQSTLTSISQRAVKPLLDALSDAKGSQQRVAIELLTHLDNPNANLPLFVYATSEGDPDLRVRAMLAVGQSVDASLLPQLDQLLFPGDRVSIDEADPISLAATWAYTRLNLQRTTPRLFALLNSDSPTAQALSLITLADRRAPGLTDRLSEYLGEAYPATTRAAAAYALGELKTNSTPQSTGQMRELAQTGPEVARGIALHALAKLRDAQFKPLVAAAIASPNSSLRDYGLRAISAYFSPSIVPKPAHTERNIARVDVLAMLHATLTPPPSPSVAAEALVELSSEIIKHARPALIQTETSALRIADALSGEQQRIGFSPLTNDLDETSPDLRRAALAAAAEIADALVPEFVVLSSHPNTELRAAALRVLASRPQASAVDAVERALTHSDAQTSRAALTAIQAHRRPEAVHAVIELVESQREWPLRKLAVETLINLAEAETPINEQSFSARDTTFLDGWPEGSVDNATKVLRAHSREDPNAFVREASLRALVVVAGLNARATLEHSAQADPELRVRETARHLLGNLSDG